MTWSMHAKDIKEETGWIRMACWVQENQMNILPNFKPQFDRDEKKWKYFPAL